MQFGILALMTLGDVATKARALTHTDTVSYTDANLLIDINIWYQKVVSMIFESQDDSDFEDQRQGAGGSAGSTATYPVQTTPMKAGQRDYRMPVSERMLKLKRVDITYDGSNWYRGTPFDTGAWPYGVGFNQASSTDANFDANFIKQAPIYDYAYNAVWVAPMPIAADVTAGGQIRTEWERSVIPFTSDDYTSVLTDSTQVPGFDLPFHPVLAWGAAYEFALANNLPQLQTIAGQLQDWELRLRTAYGRKSLDSQLQMKSIYDDSYAR